MSVESNQAGVAKPAYRIVHDRENCIGCGACSALLDRQWIMADDGKADPAKVMLSTDELAPNREAADSCPVNVIHIEDTRTGERLV